MTDAQKRDDWVHFFSTSPKTYKPWALCSVLETDGRKMLHSVLEALKLTKTEDLIHMLSEVK